MESGSAPTPGPDRDHRCQKPCAIRQGLTNLPPPPPHTPACLSCPLLPPTAKKAMGIAADSCIYTNHNFTSLQIEADGTIAEAAVEQMREVPA